LLPPHERPDPVPLFPLPFCSFFLSMTHGDRYFRFSFNLTSLTTSRFTPLENFFSPPLGRFDSPFRPDLHSLATRHHLSLVALLSDSGLNSFFVLLDSSTTYRSRRLFPRYFSFPGGRGLGNLDVALDLSCDLALY